MIEVLPLMPLLDNKLISLLSSLTDDQWKLPTTAPLWNIKDVATHLLDGNLRTLSMLRDGYVQNPPGPETNIIDYLKEAAFAIQAKNKYVVEIYGIGNGQQSEFLII